MAITHIKGSIGKGIIIFMAKITISLKNIKKKIKSLSNKNIIVKAGFFESNIADIARKNEFGGLYAVSGEYKSKALEKGVKLNDFIHIIPRPFMQETKMVNGKKWNKFLLNLLRIETVSSALDKIGNIMKNDIQNTIYNNDFARNPKHIAKIKNGDNKPLIDTGKMVNSVEYKVII